MLQNNKVLITGGAGFIGSTLANELADSNSVIVVDNGYLGIEENLSDKVDFRNQSVLASDLPTDVDIVFHLAALSSYVTNENELSKGTRVNVEGFVNVVEQAREDGCETVVYASTASLYDSRGESDSDQQSVTVNTGYEASKRAREQYAEYFANHYDLNMAGVRLLSAYQSYDHNSGHEKAYANILAQFVDDIAHGRSPALYGDGSQTRDFTHVTDAVRGLIAVAEHQLTGVYDLGTGRAVSFNELVEMITESLDTDIQPEYIQSPTPDNVHINDSVTDYQEIHAQTGWKPEIRLEDELEQMCSRYKPAEQ